MIIRPGREARPFAPPWWARGGHRQTLLGFWYRRRLRRRRRYQNPRRVWRWPPRAHHGGAKGRASRPGRMIIPAEGSSLKAQDDLPEVLRGLHRRVGAARLGQGDDF